MSILSGSFHRKFKVFTGCEPQLQSLPGYTVQPSACSCQGSEGKETERKRRTRYFTVLQKFHFQFIIITYLKYLMGCYGGFNVTTCSPSLLNFLITSFQNIKNKMDHVKVLKSNTMTIYIILPQFYFFQFKL